jgi:hypothetical protein
MKATEDLKDFDIEKAIIQHEGDTLPGFPSIDIFHFLIQPKLEFLNDPAIECVNEVHLYLEHLAEQVAQKVFFRFPSVIPEILETVGEVLGRERDVARKVVQGIVDAESSYLFTNDNSYLRDRTDIVPGIKDI